jgi:hypothetical protein
MQTYMYKLIFFYGRHVTSSWVGREYQLKNEISNPLLDVLMEVMFEVVDSVIHYRCDDVQLESFRVGITLAHVDMGEPTTPLGSLNLLELHVLHT